METMVPTSVLTRPMLREYQHDGVAFLRSRHRCILGDAPGVGKSAQVLVALDPAVHTRVIVVCPLSVCRHWEAENAKWNTGYAVHVAVGSAASRKKVIAAAQEDQLTKPVMIVTNYETVRGNDLGLLKAFRPLAVIADEGHRLKERTSKTFIATKDLIWGVPKVICVTGTPLLNRAEELWSLLHICDPKRWSSYWRFVDTYCNTSIETFPGNPQPVKTVLGLKEGIEVVLRQAIQDVMIRREQADVLPELPEIIEIEHRLDLSPAERKLYEQMAKFYFTQVRDEDGSMTQIVAPNEVSKITRLRQLACNVGLFDPEQGLSTKLKALREVVDDLAPEQVVIFSSFARVIEQIPALFNRPVGRIVGEISSSERQAVIDGFQAGSIPIIAGTIGAMSEGITLHAARHVVFVDRDWTPARNEQAVARVHRYGQGADKVVVHDLVARNTIDGYVAGVLRSKRNVIDSLISAKWSDVVKGVET